MKLFNTSSKGQESNKSKIRGFILPFTMLISVLVLLVTTTSMTLLSKQLYFSKLYRQSQAAYYAADDALACTLSIDDLYQGVDGLGIFPSSSTIPTFTYMSDVVQYVNDKRIVNDPSADLVALQSGGALPPIKCGQSIIFDTGALSYSKFATSTFDRTYFDSGLGSDVTENGVASTFTMKMDLGIDPASAPARLYRCAKVTVKKTLTFRQIISQGYSTCDNLNSSVERAVVNTTTFIP